MSTLVREPIDVSVLVSAKTGDILHQIEAAAPSHSTEDQPLSCEGN
ncbi:unnamed protein product [Penicillium camemberti]|uniref:Str. FM013 n=1 Tax=Penicillium camemberti (strain FM 013) TaxID=1429867 RepID=A0A0G4PV13_PENC3|nr:unnamed protein product [Penicillium camemberti]